MLEGIYVMKINDEAPAKNSELKEKDIIISFDDQAVKTVADLQELLTYTRAGQEVSIKVKRLDGGTYVEKEFKVKLAKKSINQQQQQQQKQQKQQQNNQDNGQQQPNNGYYYDPFQDFDDIFRNFGNGMWP